MDWRILAVGFWALIFFSCFQAFGIFRLAGVQNVPAILLLSYRALDFFLIAVFLIFWKRPVRVCSTDGLFLGAFFLASLIGAVHGQFGITYMNDVAIYVSFFCRVIIFRTLLSSLLDRMSLDEILMGFFRFATKMTIVICVVSFTVVQVMILSGFQLYYQVPIEITLAAAFAISSGNVYQMLFFALFSIACGKRMILFGFLAMVLVSFVLNVGVRAQIVRFFSYFSLVLLGLFAVFTFYISGAFNLDGLPFIRKMTFSYELFVSGYAEASDITSFLMLISPDRFIEYLSLQDHIDGWNFIVGNGLGFRYNLDSAFSALLGLNVTQASVSNAHFTPLAIIAKFGLIGLVTMVIVFNRGLFRLSDEIRSSICARAAYLALLSLLLQSLFAFGLFINPYTSFVLAIISLRLHSRPVPVLPAPEPSYDPDGRDVVAVARP